MKSSVWDEASKALRALLPGEEYEHAFSTVRLLSFQNGTAVLGVGSWQIQQTLREKYLSAIEEQLTLLTGQAIEVKFKTLGNSDSPARCRPVGRSVRRKALPIMESHLNPRYRFDNFVVGESNRFTHAAALAVAKSPATQYNPLFIYGGVGLGKTHIMQAIGNQIMSSRQDSRVVYIPAEQFVNEFVNSIKRNERQEFQACFRNVDVLLIDDIHFLVGKESSQEEFFHTFNALYNAHRQIVLSSDRTPKELPTIEQRLLSRFESGLVTDIQPPDLETRLAILRKRCEEESVQIPDEITFFIANRVKDSIRELEGALIKVAAYSSLNNEPVTLDTAAHILRDFLSREDREVSIEKIVRRVAEHHGLKTQELLGSSRSRSVALPRQIAMYLSRELTRHSFPEISAFFGKKDHSTVMHACKKITRERQRDENFRRLLERLTYEIRSQSP